ncbi:MAG: YfiR family protein [Desulfobacteraceae bacterium]|nr:YfiR family protein [Desulfobacteraceae bacterium]
MKLYGKQIKESLCVIVVLFIIMAASLPAFAKSRRQVPINVQVTLFTRLLYFHNGISNGGNITICVIGSSEFAREMKKKIGTKIGTSKLAEVRESNDIPTEKPSVIYLNDPGMLEKVIQYTRKNKVLSISGKERVLLGGITLGIVDNNRKPKIMLNLSSSVEEGVDWNHAILKVASSFK